MRLKHSPYIKTSFRFHDLAGLLTNNIQSSLTFWESLGDGEHENLEECLTDKMGANANH